MPEAETSNYLYRGVHKGHPDAENAIKGRVEPGDINSSISPELHNEGNVSGISPYTSWTRDPKVAKIYSKEDGLILRVEVGPPKSDDKWSWEYSKDRYFEQEVLMKGARSGDVEVYKP